MIIGGRQIAGEILADIADGVRKLPKPPRLAAVLVGDTGNARKFLELKKNQAEKIGIECRIYEFPENITTQELRKEVVGIAKAGINLGVIVELPLPSHINAQYILNAIPPGKDPDVLSEKSQGSFFAGRSAVLPPAVEAVKVIFQKHDIDPKGKNCAVFGYGLLVGKPISHWLAANGATVTIINEHTHDPAFFSRESDIVISGVGKPGLIKSDMIKERAVVIDFGYEYSEGHVAGDVEFDGVSKKSALITPVPGGVGPIVVAAVFKNLTTLLKNQIA